MSGSLNSRQVRYIIASVFNTIFGYAAIVFLHALLYPAYNMIVVGVLANILGITVSFSTYRIFVFMSNGNWLIEYLRCYMVYGGVALISIVGLWLLVDVLGLSVWLAPLIITPVCFIASYVSHSKFTFRQKLLPDAPSQTNSDA